MLQNLELIELGQQQQKRADPQNRHEKQGSPQHLSAGRRTVIVLVHTMLPPVVLDPGGAASQHPSCEHYMQEHTQLFRWFFQDNDLPRHT